MAALDATGALGTAGAAAWRRRRLGTVFWLAVAWIALVLLLAFCSPLLPLADPAKMSLLARRAVPSAAHLLGTDALGRDLLARLIFGARSSLAVGLLAPLAATLIGGALGLLAGYFRGWLETITVGASDVLLAFPPLVLALAVTAYLGQSVPNLILVLAMLTVPAVTRIARAGTLGVRERDFVTAARALGASHTRILFRPRRAAAAAELGQHDRRGARQPRCRAADRLHPGHRHVPDRARLQPRWRPAALHHRSAPRRLMTGVPLLEVDNLSVVLPTERGPLRAVSGVSLSLTPGRTLGIVGESGSGKTMLSRAILRLLPHGARVSGKVRIDGRDLYALPREALRRLRGRELAVIFQDPMTSLNPVLSIGGQIAEALREHLGLGHAAAALRAVELLASVGIPEPGRRARQFPHQLSGGMRQRVAIAIALSCAPRLLIADEPTTALDVTVQAQILDLLAREREKRGMAMILITHDLGIVAGRTDAVAVMYAGGIVERAPTRALFKNMRNPYAEALLAAIPKLDAPAHTPLAAIGGAPPDPTRLPPGCAFHPRCRYAQERCRRETPALSAATAEDHCYACWFPLSECAAVPA